MSTTTATVLSLVPPGRTQVAGRSTAVELMSEHSVLMRQLARLQLRVSEQLQAATRRQSSLEEENMRLRAELMRMRTAVAWDLRPAAVSVRSTSSARARAVPAEIDMREAQAVICQTGCAGHAHPWLEPDGQCRRTGQACERLEDEALSVTASLPGAANR